MKILRVRGAQRARNRRHQADTHHDSQLVHDSFFPAGCACCRGASASGGQLRMSEWYPQDPFPRAADHVGIGSDVGIDPFDTSPKGMAEFAHELEERRKAGLSAPEEDRPIYVLGLNTPRRIEIIADRLLQRGYSGAATERVLGANFARVLAEIWAA
jgi:hypothetical protein